MQCFSVTVCLCLCGAILSLNTCNAVAATQSTDQIEVIRAAWKEREERVKSFIITWRAERLGPTPFSSEQSPGERPTLIQHQSESELRVRDAFFDLRLKRQNVDTTKLPELERQSSNAAGSQQLINGTDEAVADGRVHGYINKSTLKFGVDQIMLRAPFLAYRPYTDEFRRFSLESSVVRPHRGIIDNVECLILAEGKAGAAVQDELWLDPARSFLPMRYISMVNGKPSIQLDIAYAPDPDVDYVLAKWNFRFLDTDGNLRHSEEAEIITSMINVPIPDTDFEIVFPDGTPVWDQDSQTELLAVSGGSLLPKSQASQSSPGWQYLVIAVCIAAAACYGLLKVWRQRLPAS